MTRPTLSNPTAEDKSTESVSGAAAAEEARSLALGGYRRGSSGYDEPTAAECARDDR